MAKGQLRGNREEKKPKQTQKPVVPVSPFAGTAPKTGSKTTDSRKK